MLKFMLRFWTPRYTQLTPRCNKSAPTPADNLSFPFAALMQQTPVCIVIRQIIDIGHF